MCFVPPSRQWDGILGPASLRGAPGAHTVFPGRQARVRLTLCAVTSVVAAITAACWRQGEPFSSSPSGGPTTGRGGTCDPGCAPGGDVIVPRRLDPSSGVTLTLPLSAPGLNRCIPGHGALRWESVSSSARTTAYVSCAGVLCGSCVAPCLPVGPVSSTARARSSQGTATVHRSRPNGLRRNEEIFNPLCGLNTHRGSSPPTRVWLDARVC